MTNATDKVSDQHLSLQQFMCTCTQTSTAVKPSDHTPHHNIWSCATLVEKNLILHHSVLLPFWSYHCLHQNIWCTQALSKHLLVYHCQISHTTVRFYTPPCQNTWSYNITAIKNKKQKHTLSPSSDLTLPLSKTSDLHTLVKTSDLTPPQSKQLISHKPSQNLLSYTNAVETSDFSILLYAV